MPQTKHRTIGKRLYNLEMSTHEQLNLIKQSVSGIYCPHILFFMNEKARQLEEEIKNNR